MAVTAVSRHDARAHHTLKEMATYQMWPRLQHFRGFGSYTTAELELLRRELNQLSLIIGDVINERDERRGT